jgi:hypothetical protein
LWTITTAFDNRWSIKAGRVAGVYDADVKHYDLQLRDGIESALCGLTGAKTLSMTTKHISVIDVTPTMRQGLYFAREAWRAQSEAAAMEEGGIAGEGDATADGGGLNVEALHMHATAVDATALLTSKAALQLDAHGLAQEARKLGLVWSSQHAQAFLKTTCIKEKLLLQLAKAEYPDFFQKQLRAPVITSAAHRASAPLTTLQPVVPAGPMPPLPTGHRPPVAPTPSAQALATARAKVAPVQRGKRGAGA